MKSFTQKLAGLVSARVLLNICFWILAVFLIFVVNFYGQDRKYFYPAYWYTLLRFITTAILAGLLYANNLWLLPHYLIRGKTAKYFTILAAVSYLAGLLFSLLFAWVQFRFPLIRYPDVSIASAMRVVYPAPWYILIFFQGISWVFSFSLLLFAFSTAWYIHDHKRQKKISEEASRRQAEAELKFLKTQINPHFLFNTLNNLYALTVKKSDTAPVVVSQLSSILRYLLYESNTTVVPFEKEKEVMQAYIEIELLRLKNTNSLSFSFNADKSYNIPPLLWLPVLENVFKHGTSFINPQYFVDYKFTIENNKLSIYSRNIFKKAATASTGGIGLENLKKRLSILFPGRHTLSLFHDGNYFITDVQIQLAE